MVLVCFDASVTRALYKVFGIIATEDYPAFPSPHETNAAVAKDTKQNCTTRCCGYTGAGT